VSWWRNPVPLPGFVVGVNAEFLSRRSAGKPPASAYTIQYSHLTQRRICSTSLAKNVMAKGGSLKYYYDGKDGRLLSEVCITEALCR
jgi:hypothetical protein